MNCEIQDKSLFELAYSNDWRTIAKLLPDKLEEWNLYNKDTEGNTIFDLCEKEKSLSSILAFFLFQEPKKEYLYQEYTLLFYAIAGRYVELVQWIAENRSNLACKNVFGKSPLLFALNLEILK